MYMKNEDAPTYGPRNLMDTISEGEVLAKALEILKNRLRKPGQAMISPQSVKAFFTINLAELEHEVFAALFLDGQHRVIQYTEMFRGTLNQTSVYWPCGTWCFPFELEAFNHLGDDFGTLQVSPVMGDEQITLRVAIRLAFGE